MTILKIYTYLEASYKILIFNTKLKRWSQNPRYTQKEYAVHLKKTEMERGEDARDPRYCLCRPLQRELDEGSDILSEEFWYLTSRA